VALLPSRFIWLIAGGGLTRSFGYCFGILALREAYLLYTRGSRSALLRYIVFASLTVLSHVEFAWFVAISTGVLFLAYGRNRAGLGSSALAMGGTLVCTAPWWATVVARHGVEPFRAASQSGSSLVALDLSSPSQAAVSLAAGAVLVAIGACFCFLAATGDRRLLLLGWLGLAWLLDGRAFFWTFTVPVALALGVVAAALRARITRVAPPGVDPLRSSAPEVSRPAAWVLNGLTLVVTIFLIAGSVQASTELRLASIVLSRHERTAMEWVAVSTSPASRFAVLTGDSWSLNLSAEWFPVLAERVSVTTAQGTEWLSGGVFRQRIAVDSALQSCASRDVDCIVEVPEQFEYVYVPKRADSDCCGVVRSSLRGDPRFTLVYDDVGASIFGRTPA
ncbi:MAG: hypothetical protein QOF51_780, partial [Chloroflexota bacterium]|nr:hypothetical protein [Chloroflexota bacterium]